LFRFLSERNIIQLKVFYTWSQSEQGNIFDPGFGIEKKWDIPLLEGYDHCFVHNTSSEPGSHHFSGIKNPSLNDTVKVYQPDAVLVYGWSFHSHLNAMRYFKEKVPVYFRGDSTLLDEPGGWTLKKAARRLALRWIYRHTDKVFYAGQNNRQYFLEHGLKEDQLIFLPHAIDNNRFASPDETEIDFRASLNIPGDAICIVFAGKLEPKKDPRLLVECFLSLNMPGTFLVIVGNGILETELKSLAKRRTDIHFLPFQNQQNMPAVYRMADLFVLPSKGPGETWGLAVNEAMASSKAILTSNKCGCSIDLVNPGVNGEVFNAADISDLRLKLQLLLEDKQRLTAMGKESRKIINGWSFEKSASIIENELV
jgi:glycosyltransferase involved in cell wall biosynthesis